VSPQLRISGPIDARDPVSWPGENDVAIQWLNGPSGTIVSSQQTSPDPTMTDRTQTDFTIQPQTNPACRSRVAMDSGKSRISGVFHACE